MRNLCIVIVSALLTCAAIATPVRELPREEPFQLERLEACRGERDGELIEPGVRFEAGERALYVWFSGQPGSRATPLKAVVTRTDPPRSATQALSVPARSDGGLISLRLESGKPLPVGAYRVMLTSESRERSVEFTVVPRTATASRLTRLSDGFSLVPPEGWEAVNSEEFALMLLRSDEPEASAIVMVRYEPRPTGGATVADHVMQAVAGDGAYRIIRRGTVTVGDRTSFELVVEDSEGRRSKLVVVPREPGSRCRAFFGLIVSAGAGGFAVVEAEFDRMLGTFRVVAPGIP